MGELARVVLLDARPEMELAQEVPRAAKKPQVERAQGPGQTVAEALGNR